MADAIHTPLALDGNRPVYVEPAALTASGGRLLLAGSPNYVWTTDAQGRPTAVERNEVFGVTVEPDGSVRAIPSPIDPARIRDVRALPDGEGGWEVLFVEADVAWDPPESGRTARVWYGILDRAGWHSLEQLPLHGTDTVAHTGTSSLVRSGSLLAWAAPVRSGGRDEIVFFQRSSVGWTGETIPIRNPAYVRLSPGDAEEFLLVVIQPDPIRGGANNSLDLFAKLPTWRLLQQMVASGAEEMFDPLLSTSGSDAVLSWWVDVRDGSGPRREARALLGSPAGWGGDVLVVDSAISRFSHLVLPGGQNLWVTDHGGPGADPREIRFLQVYDGAPLRIAGVPSPFTGAFAVATMAPSDVLLAGPVLDRTERSPPLVSWLLRYRVHCADSPSSSRRSRSSL